MCNAHSQVVSSQWLLTGHGIFDSSPCLAVIAATSEREPWILNGRHCKRKPLEESEFALIVTLAKSCLHRAHISGARDNIWIPTHAMTNLIYGSPLPAYPECAVCGTRKGLSRCKNCQVVVYCSPEHQTAFWQSIKQHVPPSEKRETNSSLRTNQTRGMRILTCTVTMPLHFSKSELAQLCDPRLNSC